MSHLFMVSVKINVKNSTEEQPNFEISQQHSAENLCFFIIILFSQTVQYLNRCLQLDIGLMSQIYSLNSIEIFIKTINLKQLNSTSIQKNYFPEMNCFFFKCLIKCIQPTLEAGTRIVLEHRISTVSMYTRCG